MKPNVQAVLAAAVFAFGGWLARGEIIVPPPGIPGGGPTHLTLSRDGTRLYVNAVFANRLYVLDARSYAFLGVVELRDSGPCPYGPDRMSVSPDGRKIYTAGGLCKYVQVIDLARNRVVSSLATPFAPHDIAFTPDGRLAVVEMAWDRLLVVDVATDSVARTIPLDPSDRTFSLVVSADSRKVYVASAIAGGPPSVSGRISVVDLVSGSVIDRFDVPRQFGNQGIIELSPDGRKLYLPSFGGTYVRPSEGPNRVYVIDLAARAVVADIPVVGGPKAIRISADGTTGYVTTFAAGAVAVLDLVKNVGAGELEWKQNPPEGRARGDLRNLEISPDGQRLYIVGIDAAGVFVADLRTRTVTDFIWMQPQQISVSEMALSRDGRRVFVSGSRIGQPIPWGGRASLWVIDTASQSVIQEIIFEFESYAPIMSADGRFVYICSWKDLLEIDASSGRIVRRMPMEEGGYDLALIPGQERLYMTHPSRKGSRHVSVVDLKTGAVIKRIEAGWSTHQVAVTRDGRRAYVSRSSNDQDIGGLTVIDTGTDTVTATLPPPAGTGSESRTDALAISPDQKYLYWTTHADYLNIIDLATLKRVKTVEWPINLAGVHPTGMAFTSDGRRAYISCGDAGYVAVLDLATNTVVDHIFAPDTGPGVVITPDGRFVFVSTVPDVIVIDTATNKIVKRIPLKHGIQTLREGVVNAASYHLRGVAPGDIVSVFGASIGPTELVGPEITPSGLFSKSLAGTSITFDGVPAPLLYARHDQVGAVVPYSVRGRSETQFELVRGDMRTTFLLPLLTANPGIFTADRSGRGQAAVLNQDGTWNSPSNPAPRGSTIVFWATGMGETEPPGVDGRIATEPLTVPANRTRIFIGQGEGTKVYAGAAPGAVAGLFQFNVIIISNRTETGDAVPLWMSVGNVNSRDGVTVAVR